MTVKSVASKKATGKHPVHPVNQAARESKSTQSTHVSSHNSPYGSSILDRQGIYGREHGDPMDDVDVKMAIWCIYLNVTLRAAVHLGQDYEVNSRNVKKNHWQRTKTNLWSLHCRFQRCDVDVDKLLV